ncbi:unnamed protein product, partial [Trichobilharzia regenti]
MLVESDGYEIHLSASLYQSTDWLATMQRIIEISEREESNMHGSQITPDIFEALPSTKNGIRQFDENDQAYASDNED